MSTPADDGIQAAQADARRMSLYEFHFFGRSIFELVAEAEVAHGESVMLVNNKLLIEVGLRIALIPEHIPHPRTRF